MSEPTQTRQDPILRTKLHRPVVPEDFLCRPRLYDLMNLDLELPLTLVSAPAGYGKSLLVSQWTASRSVPCAWLSLDGSDSAVDLFVDGIQLTQTYLLREVIAVQPPELRHCLLRASLLERFCAGVCDALAKADTRPEAEPAAAELRGSEFIERLRDGNLFTIALDDQGHWFRYHHLFGDLLRVELEKSLDPAAIAELHREASDWFEQQGLIDEAIRHALMAGDTIRDVFIHLIAGDLGATELSNRRLKKVANGGQYAYAEAWSDYLQGTIHLQRNELDVAVELLERSVSQRYIHHKRAALDSFAGLTYAYQALGRSDDAEVTLQLLREYVATLDDPQFWGLADAVKTRLAIMQGRPEPAVDSVRSNEPPTGEAMLWWLEIPALTRCRALIAQGSSTSLAEAQEWLRRCATLNETHHNPAQLIGILALQALAYDRQSRVEHALDVLERALILAAPGGWVWPFLESGPAMAALLKRLADGLKDRTHIDQLLAAFPEPALPAAIEIPAVSALPATDAAGAGTTKRLTIREEQILELLAERLRDKEIADRLSISTQTVNFHLKNLYRKLGVSSRREAAAKGAIR